MNLIQKQKLAKKVEPFTLKEGNMFKVGQNNILHKCLTTWEAYIVLKELHKVAKIPFVVDITTKKILDVGYWWPTLFKDTRDFAKVVIVIRKSEDSKRIVWPSW